MVVSTLCGAGQAILHQEGLLLCFRLEDNNVDFTHAQPPHYYRMRQVEPCHQLGEIVVNTEV